MGRQCHERHSLLSYKPSSESTGLLHIDLRRIVVQLYSIRHRFGYSPPKRSSKDSAPAPLLRLEDEEQPCSPAGGWWRMVATAEVNPSLHLLSRASPLQGLPLGNTFPRENSVAAHVYKEGNSSLRDSCILSCSEQDHRRPSVLENHSFTDHVVQTHSHIDTVSEIWCSADCKYIRRMSHTGLTFV
jgi:hypothetical protein